jgi:hypothetical protein
MRSAVVVPLFATVCALVVAGPAQAELQAYAVLPTQSAKDDVVDAELVAHVMRAALAEQGLTLVPADAVTSSAQANATACQQSALACARLVGGQTGAARVVASELFRAGAGYELRVVLVDVKSGVEAPGSWRSFKAADRAALGLVAQQAVVQVARPEAFFGRLTVTMSPGAEVIVDGVARDRTPLFAPLPLSVGRHEVEVRSGRLVPWRGFVTIEFEQLTTLTLCAPDAAITDRCAPSTATPDATSGLRQPLLLIGGVATGLGAVGLVVGSIAAGNAAGALQRYRNGDVTIETRDAAQTAQNIAIAAFAIGGVGFVGGLVSLAASTTVE